MRNNYLIRKERVISIQRAITEINNPYPPDNLITCYKDFLKVRDFLYLYKFNQRVLQALLDLADDLWESNKRISRISLLQMIKRYGFKNEKDGVYNPNNIDLKTRRKVFLLFRYCFEKPEFIKWQIDEAKQICNYILINLSLSSEEEKWLCNNANKSEIILNRILRYPKKSDFISNWAKKNYLNENCHQRRAEIASWLIDKNPGFQIEKRTLIDDFEYLNEYDMKVIREYEEEQQAKQMTEQISVLGVTKTFTVKSVSELFTDEVDLTPEYITDPSKRLKLTKRFYGIPMDSSKSHFGDIPDFTKLRESFYAEVDKTIKVTTLWAIAYSRLGKNRKSQLLKKHYDEETYWSFFRICKKCKLTEVLEWLKEKQ